MERESAQNAKVGADPKYFDYTFLFMLISRTVQSQTFSSVLIQLFNQYAWVSY